MSSVANLFLTKPLGQFHDIPVSYNIPSPGKEFSFMYCTSCFFTGVCYLPLSTSSKSGNKSDQCLWTSVTLILLDMNRQVQMHNFCIKIPSRQFKKRSGLLFFFSYLPLRKGISSKLSLNYISFFFSSSVHHR